MGVAELHYSIAASFDKRDPTDGVQGGTQATADESGIDVS